MEIEMQEYYELLGLTETATDEEITARYEELKAKYKEDRWLDGEAGNEAAKMLTKLETAYAEVMSARREQKTTTDGENVYEEIARLLKENNVEQEQTLLDACNERPAEWHYFQAVIFYKKNWINDSKKQLEIAMDMDPTNAKYRAAYGKMNAKNDYQRQTAGNTQNPYANTQSMPEEGGGQMGGNACSQCISCCYTYMCVSCLLNCCCGCN